MFIPSDKAERENQLEPLNIEVEDVALKACLYYRNGASYEDIKRNLSLSHPEQAKRLLIRGLDFLLKNYNEHNEKV